MRSPEDALAALAHAERLEVNHPLLGRCTLTRTSDRQWQLDAEKGTPEQLETFGRQLFTDAAIEAVEILHARIDRDFLGDPDAPPCRGILAE